MKKLFAFSITCILLQLILSKQAYCSDRDFTYTYQSFVLDKNQRELEIWFTYLTLGNENFNNRLNHRAEFEIGLGRRVQTAFYLNLNYSAYQSYALGGFDPIIGVFYTVPVIDKDFSVGFSNEWKWQMSDPVANGIGSALYGEFSVSPDEFEVEGKIILDKKIGNFITALNLVGELEYEAEIEYDYTDPDNIFNTQTHWEKETAAEIDFGLSYIFSPHFSGGVKLVNKIVFHEAGNSSTLSGGPVVSYKSENWWFAFTALPQLARFPNPPIDYDEFQSRLIFSYHF